ncbi:uncharacterized protein DNG_09283 [Cephalotrichum gorgonifer]|uniref:ABM domain-containing protein n=1 Tax=Cephalotrichum gorgonifer TaxID=2041049 RepID=A0AAE8N7H1_9PEZI|nr:uncharacterized protein DNG_09283 [Cephalotrichum gorgonifer]
MSRYADQAALTHHMGQPYVQKLLEWTQSGTLANAPEVSALDQLEGFEFARSEVSTHPDPLLVFTELEYKPGGAETILPYWRAVFEKTQNDEPGALLWQLAKNTNNPDKLFVLHVYESRDYLMTVHASSKELKECQSFGENIQTGMKLRFLKIQGGFLYKSE